MKIIDAHMHFSNLEVFKKTAEELSGLDYSGRGLLREYRAANVMVGIGMGLTEKNKGGFPDQGVANPMLLDLERELPENVLTCVGINPYPLQGEGAVVELERIERELQKVGTVGIKIYAGYYPFYVYDQVYEPVYKLAAKYKLPVVIHSGDTYSERGLLKYSHPLTVDELAVSQRDVNFVVAHFGDPWIMETAEIISKNPNVYADLSGLIVGDEAKVKRVMGQRLFMEHIQRGLVYADNYEKVIFGTDWPLVQVGPYVEFVKALVPQEFWELVFYENALRVFGRVGV